MQRHQVLQSRICDLLRPSLAYRGWLCPEMAFCPRPEEDYRTADIGFVSQKRADLDEVHLVIEVLLPDDSASDMYAHEALCLATGCAEFWVVDPGRQTVRVTRSGSFVVYHPGEQIPLPLLGGGSLAVDAIFPPPAQ